MKYAVVDLETNTKISRFFKTESQAKKRLRKPTHVIMSKQSCVEKGIYTKPIQQPLFTHFPMELVKGLFMDNKYNMSYANQLNTENYIDFCKKNNHIILK